MENIYYLISPSSFGEFSLVWYLKDSQPRITRLILPGKGRQLKSILKADHPLVVEAAHPMMKGLADDIRRYLEGEGLDFDLEWLAWENCTAFQARVLRAEYGIPRGWVSTYGRIAEYLGMPGGARAVGNALAANPFPILIPCHRAVRSTGELGGYQGGLKMKKALLEMEGVAFHSPSKVSLKKVYY
ncbi:MAG: methylated-DNA--[protein]-cysteine S-methyltransferase [Anaerolineales bacterium]